MEVERSFAFVDLCGFTAFTEGHGVVPATQVLSSFRAAGRDIASRRGVRIAKWLGDGVMFVSTEARPLVETLVETEQRAVTDYPTLALRSGIALGKAILFEGDDYIGSPVNLAARLCDTASPHEILAGPGIEDHLPPWAEIRQEGTVAIKGFQDVLTRNQVRLRRSDAAAVDPVCGLAIPPEDAVAKAVDDTGAPVLFCSAACETTWQSLRLAS